MADEKLTVSIEGEDNASDDLRAVATGISNLSDTLASAVKSLQTASRQSNALEKSILGVGKSAKSATGGAGAFGEALSAQAQASRSASEYARQHASTLEMSASAYSRLVSESNRTTAALVKEEAQLHSTAKARQQAMTYAQKAQSYLGRNTVTGGGPDQGTRGYNNSSVSLDSLIQSQTRAQSQIGKKLVASMTERMNAEDEMTRRSVAETDKRVAAYTKEYNAAVKMEKQLKDEQNARRYAEPKRASRNVIGTSGARAAAEAQELYSREQLSQMGQFYAAQEKVTTAQGNMNATMFTARFALHDIANTARIAGAALIGIAGAGITAASQYETAMAAIQRTSGATQGQMSVIRDEFIGLAQSIPAGFDEMAQIGELAGQLNISAQNVASFTETVAMFTSSTDVAVEQSAEAFGRLDALLPDVKSNYEALGSSILNVGVNSVATESAIISTTSQIAAAGAQAGLAAGEVIGLAASYASLGIAPEAARGSTIRIFSEIRQAVSEGGASLEEYARLAGMSATAFADNWKQKPADAFMAFLGGLQTEGANAETVLRNLGITGVRDINALLRLSQNTEIVADNLGYATDGFDNATALGDAFGITSETLASRLQVLAQTVQALFASLGESGTGPFKEFVNFLIDAGKFITDSLNNPVGQTIALFGGLSTVLVGGALLITALISRLGAAGVAFRITQRELLNLVPASVRAGTAVGTLPQRFAVAAAGALTLRNALRALLASTIIGAAFTAIIAGVELFAEKSRTAADVARDRFGDLSSLTNALKKDTEALADTPERAFSSFTAEVQEVTEKQSDWASAMQQSVGAASTLKGSVEDVNGAIKDQNILIDENAKKWWANALANDTAMADMFKMLTDFNNKYGSDIDPTKLIQAYIANDAKAIKAETDSIIAQIQAVQIKVSEMGGNLLEVGNDAFDLKGKINEAFDGMSGVYDAAVDKTEYLRAVSEATGVDMVGVFDGATDSADDLGGSVKDAASKMREIVDAAFEVENALSGSINAADRLFSGLESNGYMFDALSVGGSANMKNLQDAIVATIVAAEAAGISAVDATSALFVQLQNQGVDTLNLISSMAPALNALLGSGSAKSISAAVSGQRELSTSAQQLSGAFANVAQNAKRAASGTGGAGRAAKEAAKEVRTLVDYANDLSGVWKRAFDIRFGSMKALDDIKKSWLDIRDGIREARKEYLETQRTIASLKTERSDLEYYLKVAIDYGDTMRAAEIMDELRENSADLAEEQGKAKEAQAKMDKGTKGNTKTAIENREELLGLVGQYQDYVEQLAASGLSQNELKRRVEILRGEFVKQATQMGYSRSEVSKYAASFADMSTVISRIPRNITIGINPNPALQALAEFEAKAKKAGRNASNSIRTGGGGGYKIPAISMPIPKSNTSTWTDLGYRAGRAMRSGLINGISVIKIGNKTLFPQGTEPKVFGYARGGYTGSVGVNDVAGVVHGREYVINAENTSRLGLNYLNALNSGKTPAAPSGTQVVELSSYDRQLLADAGNVSLAIDGKVIANASNAANFVSAKRGTN